MKRNIEIDLVVEAKCIATERQESGEIWREIRNWAEAWESRVTRTRGRPLGSRGPDAQSPARPWGLWGCCCFQRRRSESSAGCGVRGRLHTGVREVTGQKSITWHTVLSSMVHIRNQAFDWKPEMQATKRPRIRKLGSCANFDCIWNGLMRCLCSWIQSFHIISKKTSRPLKKI